MYHIRLRPKSTFTLGSVAGLEYAAFVPSAGATINGTAYSNSELMVFGADGGDLVFSCSNINGSDIFLFGGRPYEEPIVAQGPFVMNSHQEIALAYQDFFGGKYGAIDYTVGSSVH